MDTVGERLKILGHALLVAGGWAVRLLGRLSLIAFGAIAIAVFSVLCVCEVSKRLWIAAAVVAIGCVVAAVRVGLEPGMAWPIVAAALLGLALLIGSWTGWVEYRRKLSFLAEAHPSARAVYVEADFRERFSGGRWGLPVAATVLAFALVAALWQAASWQVQTLLIGGVCAIGSVAFGALAGIVLDEERRRGVRYFVRGCRLADPAALEAKAAERWPALAGVLGWRARLGQWLEPLLGGLWRACAEPYGSGVG